MKGFGDVKGSRDRKKLPRVEEVVQTIDWSKTKGKYLKLRLLPPEQFPFTAIAQQWVAKTVDGEKGVKEVKFPRLVYGYQPLEDSFAEGTEGKDPYLKNGKSEMARSYYVNCIVRVLEGERLGKPTIKEKKTGFKDPDSDSKTPVRAIRFPFSVIKEIAKLEQLNEHTIIKKGKKVKKTFPVSHAKYGRDIMIANDPTQPPAKQYSVQLGDKAPLTDKEQEYLTWDLVGLAKMFTCTETLEEVTAEYNNDFPEDEPKAKGKGAGKGKTYFDDDDNDDDKKGKKKKKKISKGDNFDLDDDKPSKKSKLKDKPSKKSKLKDKPSKKSKLKSKGSDKVKSKKLKKSKDVESKKVKGKVKKAKGKKSKAKDDDLPF